MSKVRLLVALLAAQAPVLAWAQSDTTVDLTDLRSPTSIENRLRKAIHARANLTHIVRNGTVRHGEFTLQQGDSLAGHFLVIDGETEIRGKLVGNLVALDGNVTVYPGGVVSGDILAFNGEVRDQGGHIGGTARAFGLSTNAAAAPPPVSALERAGRRFAWTASMFLVLLALGIGFVLFARSKLAIVAGTVVHSFGRSLLVGLVGQSLLLPTFGILIVGLVVSVVGILLLPFVIVAYVLLVAVGLVGGYLAVAHAIGEVYTRRRLTRGAVASPNSYRYLVLGLGTLAALWVIRALFGWVPVAGVLLWGAAFSVTWLLVTAGFGAMLLSRGGTRTNFAGWES